MKLANIICSNSLAILSLHEFLGTGLSRYTFVLRTFINSIFKFPCDKDIYYVDFMNKHLCVFFFKIKIDLVIKCLALTGFFICIKPHLYNLKTLKILKKYNFQNNITFSYR